MTIREMTVADHAAVLAIAEGLPEWFDETARRQSIPIDLKHQEGFVAAQDGTVVGFVTLYVTDGKLTIGWLGVRKESQRQGIGSALIRQAEERARQLGIRELATYTLGDSVEYLP